MKLNKQHYPKFLEDNNFLHCRMPDCKGFATSAALFVRHMKRKHGITVRRIDVAARQLRAIIFDKKGYKKTAPTTP